MKVIYVLIVVLSSLTFCTAQKSSAPSMIGDNQPRSGGILVAPGVSPGINRRNDSEPAKESVGKKLSVFSVPSWCIFFLAISTRRHGDHGVYTEESDFSDRLL